MEKKNNLNVESDSTVLNEKNVAAGTKVAAKSAKSSKIGSAIWKSVLVGGVPGILIGATGASAVTGDGGNDGENTPGSGLGHTGGGDAASYEIHEAHSVSDDMTFSEAFAAARAEVGPGGAFCWHGQVYGTYRADDPEWQEMSDADRAEHSQAILSQVHADPYTPTDDEPVIEPDPDVEPGPDEPVIEPGPDVEPGSDEPAIDSVDSVGEDVEGEVDVHIVGVENVELSDGSEVQVGIGEVDGMDAVFVDTTGDGEVDTVLIDIDGDGEVGQGEAFDAEGAGITMEDIQAEADLAAAEMPDDQLYADMPDYTNDADMSSLA